MRTIDYTRDNYVRKAYEEAIETVKRDRGWNQRDRLVERAKQQKETNQSQETAIGNSGTRKRDNTGDNLTTPQESAKPPKGEQQTKDEQKTEQRPSQKACMFNSMPMAPQPQESAKPKSDPQTKDKQVRNFSGGYHSSSIPTSVEKQMKQLVQQTADYIRESN